MIAASIFQQAYKQTYPLPKAQPPPTTPSCHPPAALSIQRLGYFDYTQRETHTGADVLPLSVFMWNQGT